MAASVVVAAAALAGHALAVRGPHGIARKVEFSAHDRAQATAAAGPFQGPGLEGICDPRSFILWYFGI